MQNLIYSLITEKEIKRHIKIMEMLTANSKRLEYREMQDALGVTVKTLKNDVSDLQKKMPPSLKISCEKQYIFLIAEDKENIQDFIFSLVKKALSYRILNYAYNKPVVSLDELAKHLFTSQTTLKNRIKQINLALQKFRCKLSTYNSSIIGLEANIRYLYYTYYTELQEVFNISKYQGELEHKKIFEALREELIRKKLKRINYSYFQLRQWLRVTVDRIFANHSLKLNPTLTEKLKKETSYKDFEIVYKTIVKKHFNLIEVSEDEVIWAYLTCLDTVVYSKYFSGLEIRRSENLAKTYMKKISLFIVKISDSLNIDDADKKNFNEVHNAFFENVFLLSKMTSVFQIASPKIKSYVKQNLKYLYHMWRTTLIDTKETFELPSAYLDDLCCKLSMITSQFIYNKKPQIKTALFSFSGEAGIPNYLETMARNVIPKEIECIFICNELLSMDMIFRVNPEIVVCNYNNIEDIPFSNIIKMPYLPTIKDWTTLMDFILKGNTLN